MKEILKLFLKKYNSIKLGIRGELPPLNAKLFFLINVQKLNIKVLLNKI